MSHPELIEYACWRMTDLGMNHIPQLVRSLAAIEHTLYHFQADFQPSSARYDHLESELRAEINAREANLLQALDEAHQLLAWVNENSGMEIIWEVAVPWEEYYYLWYL
jgi:DNA-binding transcriptional MocR family regulator